MRLRTWFVVIAAVALMLWGWIVLPGWWAYWQSMRMLTG
jgi:hypothetical protein